MSSAMGCPQGSDVLGVPVDITRDDQVERMLAQAMERIPAEYGRPVMGPLTTGLGEVYQFTLKGTGYSPMALRTLLEWEIGMRLRAVPGVVEVNTRRSRCEMIF